MNSPAWKNKLFYGDNLDVLRKHHEDIPDGSVDLVYLDPPFNSNATYNVLFAERDGSRAASQLQAFGDTWKWNSESAAAYFETVEHGPERVSRTLQAFRTILTDSNMLAYLSMMAPRLVELRRVLASNGSLYLHCDPNASHYLKLLLDSVFGQENFRNEIIWKRTSAHSGAKRFGPVHDVILFYTRGDGYLWNAQFKPYDDSYIESHFGNETEDGEKFYTGDLTGPGTRKGPSGQPWRSFNPTARGRHWQPASYLYDKFRQITNRELNQYPLLERLDHLDEEKLIYWPKKKDGWPRYKQFLADREGVPLQDMWTDIDVINSQATERLKYPTQKPETLLERIIKASSNEGQVILDPFCGCGTAISVAEQWNRRWIGIDVTQAAIVVIKQQRLAKIDPSTYQVIGEPVTVPDAVALAEQEPYQFQWWAVGLLSAHAVERKKGKDRGIDGRLDFHDDQRQTKHVMISVKGGQRVKPEYLRDLRGVMEREQAQIGVLVLRDKPTRDMRAEAASAGFYYSPWMDKKYPRLQILTIQDLIERKPIDMPDPDVSDNVTFRKGPKRETKPRAEQIKLFKQSTR